MGEIEKRDENLISYAYIIPQNQHFFKTCNFLYSGVDFVFTKRRERFYERWEVA